MKAGERFDRNYGASSGNADFSENWDFETDRIRISGSSDFENAEARIIEISGSARIKRSVRCDRLECSGSLETGGELTSKAINVSGSIKIGGNMRSVGARISGRCAVVGNYVSDETNCTGSIECGGDLESRNIEIAGRLAAASIAADSISLNGGGRAETVRCGDIRINMDRHGRSHFGLLHRWKSGNRFAAERMEVSGSASLSNCSIAELRARRALISGGCVVDKLYYSESFVVEEDGIVRERIRQQ
ncbi:MAG: hypothetical protein KIY12_05835 [Thermoplasmata archaeon]|uniref:Polymer-forming cytoskeletal protein n=1 Tax=Candidatus Sysuiplasma superficiale TaxID=2823368 RepID=A0A8J7YXK5_9ARCH|nr:hypothetical protein [Candidatus Sysuiplasma superficiale]MBX8644226.1 hypothetical protein [Candidatus Sysuiplasma superficiale]